jgi:hypothetical protein
VGGNRIFCGEAFGKFPLWRSRRLEDSIKKVLVRKVRRVRG